MPSPDFVQSRLLQDVLDRSASDPAFRRALLERPADAIHGTFGVQLPAGFRIRFVERDADLDALVVLPDPRRDDGELDDEALERAAGGTGTPVTWDTPVDSSGGQP